MGLPKGGGRLEGAGGGGGGSGQTPEGGGEGAPSSVAGRRARAAGTRLPVTAPARGGRGGSAVGGAEPLQPPGYYLPSSFSTPSPGCRGPPSMRESPAAVSVRGHGEAACMCAQPCTCAATGGIAPGPSILGGRAPRREPAARGRISPCIHAPVLMRAAFSVGKMRR